MKAQAESLGGGVPAGSELYSSGSSKIRSSNRIRSVRVLHVAWEQQQRRLNSLLFTTLAHFSLTSGSTDTKSRPKLQKIKTCDENSLFNNRQIAFSCGEEPVRVSSQESPDSLFSGSACPSAGDAQSA